MRRIVVIVGIVSLILLGGGGVAGSIYWYRQYQTIIANPQAGSAEEGKALVKKLSAFMELPAETPSVVTITDREKLQDQEFFQKAINGDKIIIFEAAKRIMLYRPSTNRLIDVAPLIFNAPIQDTEQRIPQIE